jgi:hypothetical protein
MLFLGPSFKIINNTNKIPYMVNFDVIQVYVIQKFYATLIDISNAKKIQI